jgi:hypothetical protein
MHALVLCLADVADFPERAFGESGTKFADSRESTKGLVCILQVVSIRH